MFAFLLWLLSHFCAAALADGPSFLTQAKVYESSDTTRPPVFLYENTVTDTTDSRVAHTAYKKMDGTTIAEEESDFTKGKLSRYVYKQFQLHDEGEARIENNRIYYRYSSQGVTKTDSQALEPSTISTHMVISFLKENWAHLQDGETLRARLILVERLETIGFKFHWGRERVCRGVGAVDIIMKPSSFFISLVAPRIRITIEKAPPHRLLETFGRLPARMENVPNPQKRSDYHALDGMVLFDWH